MQKVIENSTQEISYLARNTTKITIVFGDLFVVVKTATLALATTQHFFLFIIY